MFLTRFSFSGPEDIFLFFCSSFSPSICLVNMGRALLNRSSKVNASRTFTAHRSIISRIHSAQGKAHFNPCGNDQIQMSPGERRRRTRYQNGTNPFFKMCPWMCDERRVCSLTGSLDWNCKKKKIQRDAVMTLSPPVSSPFKSFLGLKLGPHPPARSPHLEFLLVWGADHGGHHIGQSRPGQTVQKTPELGHHWNRHVQHTQQLCTHTHTHTWKVLCDARWNAELLKGARQMDLTCFA